jgi:hypothetical protein
VAAAWNDSVTMASTSDLDLYAFCDSDMYARLPRLLKILPEAGICTVTRERSTFLESHYLLPPLPEIDLKVMRWSTVDTIIDAQPNLDELYLEKMHSLHHYQVILDESDGGLCRINRAKRRISEDIAKLLPCAFESYVKHAWGVAKQGLRRDERLVGRLLAHRALDYLVLIEYLLNGIYPPPFKWRMHTSQLAKLRRGDLIRDVTTEIEFTPGISLDSYARSLRDLEASILSDAGASEIPGKLPVGWWWAP